MNLTGLMGKEAYAILCPRCRWHFQCPVEQISKRIYCYSCEGKPPK